MSRPRIFSIMEKIEKQYNENLYGQRNDPRRVTDEELEDWHAAMDAQQPTPRTVAEIRARIKATHPLKFRQMQSDMRWLEKQFKKMGLNPDDARYIL